MLTKKRGFMLPAVGTDLRPPLRRLGAAATGEQIQHSIGYHNAVRRIEPRRLDHGAGFDAFAAFRARVEDVIDLAAKGIEKRNAAKSRSCHPALLPPARLCLSQSRDAS